MHELLTEEELIASLQSEICPACGRSKMFGQTLCRKQYNLLPREMQRALYQRLGEGYAEAVDAALSHLGVQRVHLPRERRRA